MSNDNSDNDSVIEVEKEEEPEIQHRPSSYYYDPNYNPNTSTDRSIAQISRRRIPQQIVAQQDPTVASPTIQQRLSSFFGQPLGFFSSSQSNTEEYIRRKQ